MSTVEDIASELLGSGALEVAQEGIAEAMFTGMAESLTGPVNPAALARARRLAQTAANSLTKQLTESQLRSMGETIARGLAAGKRPRDLYNQLQEVGALDANRARTYLKIHEYLEASDLTDAQLKARLDREYQKLLQDRRKTIAQNEGRQATSEARALEAGETGLEMKAWTTTNAGNVCDTCAGNEAAGVIPIEREFPSGHSRTPAHPDCHCTIVYVKKGLEADILAKRQQRYIEETAAAREAEGIVPAGPKMSSPTLRSIDPLASESATIKSLSRAEEEARQAYMYVNREIGDINEIARGIIPDKSGVLNQMDSAISKSRMSETVTAYRGISGEFAASIPNSGEFLSPGYTSVSLQKQNALRYAWNPDGETLGTVLEMKIPQFSNGLQGDSSIGELILPRNGRFQITGVHEGILNPGTKMEKRYRILEATWIG